MAMRSWLILVVISVLAAGCSSSHSLAVPYPLREYHGVGDSTVTLDAGQDATLLPQLQQAMTDRLFYLGLFQRFDTGDKQLTLQDGQVVGSSLVGVEDQSGPWNYQDGWLTLSGATASYVEPLSRIPPELTQLILRGTFDAPTLNAQVAALEALPFDPTRSAAASTSAGTVPVHWELSGLLNGVAFDEHFTQTLHVVAVDANVT